MYLLDSNIWLERMRSQPKAQEVKAFLDTVSSDEIWITDFALHSIGIILWRLGLSEAYLQFLNDMFVHGAVTVAVLEPQELPTVVQAASQYSLDFDDAYQYVAAEKLNLTLISFDKGFDATPRGRKTPAQALAGYQQPQPPSATPESPGR